MGKYDEENIKGLRFGRLVPYEPLGSYGQDGHTKSHTIWKCRCDCGTEKELRASVFVSGNTSSCGCLHRESAKRMGEVSTHGLSRTPTYSCWRSMLTRVRNENCPNYEQYSKRGVCDRWLRFEGFLADRGVRPSPKHSIERKDNDGPYASWNCVWATSKEQANNRGSNVWLTIDGVTQTASQWAEQNGLSPQAIWYRIKAGVEGRQLIAPVQNPTAVEFQGETKTITEWAAAYGMNVTTLRGRLSRGWTVAESLETPVGPTGRNYRYSRK